MDNHDVMLFNTAIHSIKALTFEIKSERDKYHTKLETFKQEPDTELNKLMKQLLEVLDIMQEMFGDLYENNKKEKE